MRSGRYREREGWWGGEGRKKKWVIDGLITTVDKSVHR